jgi:hypothetical protein
MVKLLIVALNKSCKKGFESLQLKLSSDCKASSHLKGRRKVLKKAWICAACNNSEMPFLVVGMRRIQKVSKGHFMGFISSDTT